MHTDILDNLCDLLGIDRTMIGHGKIGLGEREHLAVSLGRGVRGGDDVVGDLLRHVAGLGEAGRDRGSFMQDNIGSFGVVHEEVVGIGVT